jgi:hypothetical protein
LTRKSPVLYLAASLLAYFALWIGIPKARFLPAILDSIDAAMRHSHQPLSTVLSICGIIVMSVPTITFMVAQISVVYYFTKLRLGFRGSALWLAGCLVGLAVVVGIMLWRVDAVAKLHRFPNLQEIGFIVGIYRPGPLKMVMYAINLLAASSIGYMVSLRIKDRNLLLPVVMFAASIDFWTVTAGPVSSVMSRAPEIVKAVSAPIPQAGTGAFVPALMMGMGDPLFMAVVFAAVHRLGLNARRNFVFVLIAMTLAMLAVLMGLVPYLPALVALAVAVVAANWGEFKLTKQEKISTAIVAAVLIATMPLVWYALKPRTPAKKPPAAIAEPKSRP